MKANALFAAKVAAVIVLGLLALAGLRRIPKVGAIVSKVDPT